MPRAWLSSELFACQELLASHIRRPSHSWRYPKDCGQSPDMHTLNHSHYLFSSSVGHNRRQMQGCTAGGVGLGGLEGGGALRGGRRGVQGVPGCAGDGCEGAVAVAALPQSPTAGQGGLAPHRYLLVKGSIVLRPPPPVTPVALTRERIDNFGLRPNDGSHIWCSLGSEPIILPHKSH